MSGSHSWHCNPACPPGVILLLFGFFPELGRADLRLGPSPPSLICPSSTPFLLLLSALTSPLPPPDPGREVQV